MAASYQTLCKLESETYLNYPDVPTGSVADDVQASASSIPKPTDGSYQ